MRKLPFVAGGIAVVALLAFVVVRMQTRKPADELSAVPRTPLSQAAAEFDGGRLTVIDVRDADSYIAGHIPGALQIPLMRIEGEVNYLPRDKPILTYCT